MTTPTSSPIDAVRSFNRFYTKQIGLLHKGYLESQFSLAEVRVLYELAHRDGPTASELARDLDLDPGYLSRILMSFEKNGYLARTTSETDARQNHLSLTHSGKEAFAPLEESSARDVAAMLARLTPLEQGGLTGAMHKIEKLLGGRRAEAAPYMIRTHQPGDMGWVVQRHGELYWTEYGLDERFEALVAAIVAQFIQNFDPRRERCWIAEKDGERVGSIFLVRGGDTVAKLRLFLMEPSARGLGIGKRLVEECIRFARQSRYRVLTLWTQSILHAARHIYQSAGFHLVKEESHHSWGQDLVAQTWELPLEELE